MITVFSFREKDIGSSCHVFYSIPLNGGYGFENNSVEVVARCNALLQRHESSVLGGNFVQSLISHMALLTWSTNPTRDHKPGCSRSGSRWGWSVLSW